MMSQIPPEFIVKIDYDTCRRCKRCVMNCSFGCMQFKDRVVPDHKKCVACHRCTTFCPESAISITKNELAYKDSANWLPETRQNILKQAETGGILLTGMGNPRPYQILWDQMLI